MATDDAHLSRIQGSRDGEELMLYMIRRHLRNTDNKLDDIVDLLHQLRRDLADSEYTNNTYGRLFMASLDEIQAAVAENGDAAQSAITLIQGLADQLDDIDPGDQEALTALATQLRSQSAALAAAVVENTPADDGGDTDVPPPDDGGTPV